ncbi:MAG TPA: chemotaxis protein CheW [Anaerolineaceae bacterium]|nr:chemotaxis protein CheW [Anaerolineaceae bacterium]
MSERQLVIFELENESYGVDISAVESIIKMQPIVALPHTPKYVLGVTNLRGLVLPVVDLRERFGLPAKEETGFSRIVVVHLGETQVGMMVDDVSEVVTIHDNRIEPPPGLVSNQQSRFIEGILQMEDGRLVILLDLEKIFTAEENSALAGLEEPAG